MSSSFEHFLSVTARSMGVLVAAFAIAACSHWTDARMIEAAESLVSPESQILDVTDNSKGLKIVEGDYWAALDISDGGLGPALLEAIENRASAGAGREATAANCAMASSSDTFQTTSKWTLR